MAVYTIKTNNEGFEGDVRLELDGKYPNEKSLIDWLRSGNFYEPDVSNVVLRVLRKGDLFIDVGANVGFFTLVSAALVGSTGRVISIEPDEKNLDRLKTSAGLNSFNNIILIKRPVSDKVQDVDFFINHDDSGGNALWDPGEFPGNIKSKAKRKSITMSTTTLDILIAEHGLLNPKLIKVDTEGAEQNILEGGCKLLQGASVPFVIAELHEFGLKKMGYSQQTLRSFMENLGYSTFILFFNGVLPKLIPPKTQIRSEHIINLLFSTPEAVSEYWPEETISVDSRIFA